MEINDFERVVREERGSLSLAFPALMRKVYVWMTLALAISGLTAYGVAHSENLLALIYGKRRVFWGLIIADLAVVFAV